jgi:pimeloyl-ACP methyl ester carboxylesterase
MAQITFQRIWNSSPWTVDFLDGPGQDLVIAFSSVGHDPTRAPSPEFVATATANGTRRALFVMDASRSWANDPGFEQALIGSLETVLARRPVTRIATIGLSMGAFSALVAALILPVDVVLAFGPQWSVAPGIVPAENRWSHWTDRLPPRRWQTAPLPTNRQTYLFHGTQDDLPQALPFPRQPGTDHILFPDLGHSDLLPHLKARGALAGLLDSALSGDRRRLLRIAASAGGRLRQRLPYG